jgi:hypothetical protein
MGAVYLAASLLFILSLSFLIRISFSIRSVPGIAASKMGVCVFALSLVPFLSYCFVLPLLCLNAFDPVRFDPAPFIAVAYDDAPVLHFLTASKLGVCVYLHTFLGCAPRLASDLTSSLLPVTSTSPTLPFVLSPLSFSQRLPSCIHSCIHAFVNSPWADVSCFRERRSSSCCGVILPRYPTSYSLVTPLS